MIIIEQSELNEMWLVIHQLVDLLLAPIFRSNTTVSVRSAKLFNCILSVEKLFPWTFAVTNGFN